MLFLYPYSNLPTNTHTLEYTLISLLGWLIPIMALFMLLVLYYYLRSNLFFAKREHCRRRTK